MALTGFDERPTAAVVFGWLLGRLTGHEARTLALALAGLRTRAVRLILVPNCDFDSGLNRGEFSAIAGVEVAVVHGDSGAQGTPAGERVSFSSAALSAAQVSFRNASKQVRKQIAASCEDAELSDHAVAWVVGAGALATGRVIAPKGLFRVEGDEEQAVEEVSGSAAEGAGSFRLAPKARATLVVQYD